MVREPVLRIKNRRRERAAQWISDLQVILTTWLLPDVTPGGNGVVAERIIHPFRDLVRHGRNVLHPTPEYSAGIKICRAKGLRPGRVMEAQNAARIIRGRLFRNGLCGRRRLQGLCPRAPRIYRLVPLPMLGSLQETDEKGGAEVSPLSIGRGQSALGLLASSALSSAQFGHILLGRDKRRILRWLVKG